MIHRLSSHLLGLLPVSTCRRLVRQNQKPHSKIFGKQETRQLLVDVSVIARHDAGTGIQRSVRALLRALLEAPPEGYNVRPVAATRKQGYHYTSYNPSSHGQNEPYHCERVRVGHGDIFLGLDLAANIAPHHHAEFTRWKQIGTQIHFVVYDLLPVLQPQWFNPKTRSNILRWLKTISIYGDGFICISDVVKKDLVGWQEKHYGLVPDEIHATTIPLGCDITASAPTSGISASESALLDKLVGNPAVLMVGTLEPRKGHYQVLDAFELLWLTNPDIILVIAGQPGWKTDKLLHRLNQHPENGRRLFWLDKASDEMVQKLYAACRGVVAASLGEGYGLPLLEAAYFGKPVLARDIPAFREIAKNNVTFFSDGTPNKLASSLQSWLRNASVDAASADRFEAADWQTSGRMLVKYFQDFDIEK